MSLIEKVFDSYTVGDFYLLHPEIIFCKLRISP